MSEIPMQASAIEAVLDELAASLRATLDAWEDVAFIGIRSGGVSIARYVAKALETQVGTQIPLGALDISLYRDDLSRRRWYPEVKSTEIPFSIEDKRIILVDDVLNTGRSVRAAIDHIVDLGRPRRIYLLVLFDRGGREIPIQADFVGRKIGLPEDKIIKLVGPDDSEAIGGVIITEVGK